MRHPSGVLVIDTKQYRGRLRLDQYGMARLRFRPAA
jgi:hypothetical protein